MDMSPSGLRDLADQTLPIVTAVGAELLARQHELAQDSDAKSADGIDLVTAADRLADDSITCRLEEAFPDVSLRSEEQVNHSPVAQDQPCWWLDPLDGTCNYSRGLAHWSISLGLAVGQTPIWGLVHAPALGLTVWGGAGLGAHCRLRNISNHDAPGTIVPLPNATPAGPPSSWVVATDWPWDLAKRQRTTAVLGRLSQHIRQAKMLGSAAADKALLAHGQIDAYLIDGTYPWDQCAGAAIAAALGYEIRDWRGVDWKLGRSDIVICRPGMWPVLAQACQASAVPQ